jgi:hypothetical protein
VEELPSEEVSAFKNSASWFMNRSLVLCFFIGEGDNRNRYTGSGWLLEADGTTFAVTNAHVLEDFVDAAQNGIGADLFALNGKPGDLARTSRPTRVYREVRKFKGLRGYDPRDVALLELNEEASNDLNPKTVLNYSDLDDPRVGEKCVFSGFPSDRFAAPVAHRGTAAPSWPELTVVEDISDQIVLNTKASAQRFFKIRGLYGISGCPLFRWSVQTNCRKIIGMMKSGVPLENLHAESLEATYYAVPTSRVKSFVDDVLRMRAGEAVPSIEAFGISVHGG